MRVPTENYLEKQLTQLERSKYKYQLRMNQEAVEKHLTETHEIHIRNKKCVYISKTWTDKGDNVVQICRL